ncbi:MAG: hypothetical protein ACK58T_02470 [Phycisphaerae bacterium]
MIGDFCRLHWSLPLDLKSISAHQLLAIVVTSAASDDFPVAIHELQLDVATFSDVRIELNRSVQHCWPVTLKIRRLEPAFVRGDCFRG